MVELIIFDWDDVFTLGSTEGYFKCYHEALREVGISLPPEEEDRRIRDKWGSGHVAQLEDLLREHPELVDAAIKSYERHFFGDTFINCLQIVPGAQGFLTEMAKGYRLAVATGGHPEILKKRILPAFHIPDVFEQVVTIYDIDDIAHAKPHPHMVDKILGDSGVHAADTILVGDAKNDVAMARNAGVTPVVVLTGQLTQTEAEELHVQYIINNVTNLPSVLDRLNTK